MENIRYGLSICPAVRWKANPKLRPSQKSSSLEESAEAFSAPILTLIYLQLSRPSSPLLGAKPYILSAVFSLPSFASLLYHVYQPAVGGWGWGRGGDGEGGGSLGVKRIYNSQQDEWS